ncbi:IS630 family transposase [Propionibacterium acidifaciens]|uniref:IS630 family transposase n=1 Tax=Propionibacterium acidifaciens TaxID=556499 RepID=UPI0028EE99B6|nr:IS630 family transposase [Propionibacterium acidifaciens]
MQVEVTPEETAVLIRWRKRSDNHVLARMKAEAILYASEGVGIGIIAKMVERTERTVQEWPVEWRATRMCPVLTGHAGNQDAAELTRTQKEELKAILAQPPSRTGVRAEFWDVPAIREVVKIMFDVEYQADSSYRLLLRLCGPNLEPPGPVRRAPRRESHHPTHGLGDDPGQGHVGPGPEGPHRKIEARPEHEAWTRRMQPPKGQRTRPSVDRQRTSQSFPGALPPTSRTVTPYPTEQNRNTWQTILALERLQRETEAGKIAVVPDNARSHHAKALTGLYEPGRLLERITPVFLPPYAPDHNPVEHVRNTAKSNTATIQHETPEETFGAFASYVTGRAFDYDFEHLPLRETRNDFVS